DNSGDRAADHPPRRTPRSAFSVGQMIVFSAATQSALHRTIVYLIGDAGTVSIYGGKIPASPDAPVGSQPLLAKLKFQRNPRVGPDEPFGDFEKGAAIQSGRATWARIKNDLAAIFDCDIGKTGSG